MSGNDPNDFGAPPAGGGFGAPPPAGGGFGGPPAGGPPPAGGGFGAPPPAAPPPAGGFGGPPAGGPPPGGGGFGGPPAGGPPPGGGSLGNIPFSPTEEETIRKLALFMRISGGLMIANAALSLIGAVLKTVAMHAGSAVLGINLGVNLCGGVIGAGIAAGFAFLLMQGAKAFQQVADTDGADQDFLATGFEKLKFYFMTKGILIIVGIVLVCCICGFGMVMGAGMLSQFR